MWMNSWGWRTWTKPWRRTGERGRRRGRGEEGGGGRGGRGGRGGGGREGEEEDGEDGEEGEEGEEEAAPATVSSANVKQGRASDGATQSTPKRKAASTPGAAEQDARAAKRAQKKQSPQLS